jgi:hypothetical protein
MMTAHTGNLGSKLAALAVEQRHHMTGLQAQHLGVTGRLLRQVKQ